MRRSSLNIGGEFLYSREESKRPTVLPLSPRDPFLNQMPVRFYENRKAFLMKASNLMHWTSCSKTMHCSFQYFIIFYNSMFAIVCYLKHRNFSLGSEGTRGLRSLGLFYYLLIQYTTYMQGQVTITNRSSVHHLLLNRYLVIHAVPYLNPKTKLQLVGI